MLIIVVVFADPPPKKKPPKITPKPPKAAKFKGPKPFGPRKDDAERKKERMMEKMDKKGKPARPPPPPGFDKGKGKGKGADRNGKPFRSPKGKGKGKGRDRRMPDKGKGPRGWRKPPKLPIERFGPCQACYATVSYLDHDLKNWSNETREALDYDSYCPSAVEHYSLVTAPQGRGMPIMQGPGLPDLKHKLQDGEEFGLVDDEVSKRFVRDFTKICRKTFMELGPKIFHVFTPPPGAMEDEKVMNKWKATNKRAVCDKYCRKPKAAPARKTEL